MIESWVSALVPFGLSVLDRARTDPHCRVQLAISWSESPFRVESTRLDLKLVDEAVHKLPEVIRGPREPAELLKKLLSFEVPIVVGVSYHVLRNDREFEAET